jgi:hypothetical protein
MRGFRLANLLGRRWLVTSVPDPDRAKLPQRAGRAGVENGRTMAPGHRVLELGVVIIGGLVGSSSCGGLVKISTKS